MYIFPCGHIRESGERGKTILPTHVCRLCRRRTIDKRPSRQHMDKLQRVRAARRTA